MRHPEITKFVDGYELSLRSRLGYLADLRTFFSWCEQKAYCEMNPVVAAMPSKAGKRLGDFLACYSVSKNKLPVATLFILFDERPFTL